MNLADNEVLAVIEKVEFHYFVNDEYSKSSEGKFGIYVDYRFSKRGNYSGQNEDNLHQNKRGGQIINKSTTTMDANTLNPFYLSTSIVL